MNKKWPIVILTDSGAAIRQNQIKDQPISLINFTIIIKNQSFADTPETDERYHLIEQIRQESEHVSTAQTSRFIVEQRITKLLSNYQKVLYLCVSPRLSGQYHSLKVLEKKVMFRHKLFVIPCYNAGIGQKYLVFQAAKMARQGHTCHDIMRFVKKADHQLIWTGVIVENLAVLRRSGRMQLIFASLLERVNLRLMLTFDAKRFYIKRKVTSLCKLVLKKYQRFQSHYSKQVKLVICISKSATRSHYFRLIEKVLCKQQIKYDVNYDLSLGALAHTGTHTVVLAILAGAVLNNIQPFN